MTTIVLMMLATFGLFCLLMFIGAVIVALWGMRAQRPPRVIREAEETARRAETLA